MATIESLTYNDNNNDNENNNTTQKKQQQQQQQQEQMEGSPPSFPNPGVDGEEINTTADKDKNSIEDKYKVSAVGQRLYNAQLQSVSVSGDHLSKSTHAELYRKTQKLKNDIKTSREQYIARESMANALGKKVSTVMKQITASKVNDVKRDELIYNRHVTQDRKSKERSAKITRDAAFEREIGERRLSATMLRGELNRNLLETKMEQVSTRERNTV